MTPSAELSHGLPERTRIRIRSKQGDADYFVRVAQALEKLPIVHTVRINKQSGSIVITHEEGKREQIAQYAQSAELFILEKLHYERTPLFKKAAAGFSNLDSGLNRMTEGKWDYRSCLYVVLVVAAIVQILRGQILVPAATLLWYALDLLRFAPDKPEQ